jgi:hypothetical protein
MESHLDTVVDSASLDAWAAALRSSLSSLSGRFAADLERYGLEGTPADMLENSIDVVRACVAMRELDGIRVDQLIGVSRSGYSGEAFPYRLVFDLGAGAAVLLCDAALKTIDLADLYGFPWYRLVRVGFHGFWVERVDGRALTAAEVDDLQTRIEADFAFDYGEDEISICMDPHSWPGTLHCSVCGREEDDFDD